jgi:hypothetical protein
MRQYREADRERFDADVRRGTLRRKFGITPERYEELLEAQGGVCAICQKPCSSGRRLAVDHDHEAGIVRGLLCRRCNTAIGLLGDDAVSLLRAAGYLMATTVEALN